ncbi:MAG: hypothetical protein D6748_11410, partial [Calditrichaeota bacterium]
MNVSFVKIFQKLFATGVITLCLVIFAASEVNAQLQILEVNPLPSSPAVQPFDTISVQFDRPLNLNTILPDGITLRGQLHGYYQFTFQFNDTTNTLFIQSVPAFVNGETIYLTLTENLQGMDGVTLATPFQSRFRI